MSKSMLKHVCKISKCRDILLEKEQIVMDFLEEEVHHLQDVFHVHSKQKNVVSRKLFNNKSKRTDLSI